MNTTASTDSRSVSERASASAAAARSGFVLEIVPETREVIVGDAEDLLAPGLVAAEVNWLIDPPAAPLACAAKIRYRHTAAAATVTATSDRRRHGLFQSAADSDHAGSGGRVLRRLAGPRRRLDRIGRSRFLRNKFAPESISNSVGRRLTRITSRPYGSRFSRETTQCFGNSCSGWG